VAKNVVVYDMLISCPGDAEYVISTINEVVNDFNLLYQGTLGIGIQCQHWRKSAYAESGGKPQALLNKQFVQDCDLAVAIFKTRFGTPTDKYNSGSEEEIEIMLSQGKQVFMFFDISPVSPDEISQEQYGKVQEFKNKYVEKGIFWDFSTLEEFKSLFQAHITKYFLNLQQKEELQNFNRPCLQLKSYYEGKICDIAVLKNFDMGKLVDSKKILEDIKDLYSLIPGYKVSHTNLNPISIGYTKVVMESETCKLIETVAEHLDISIDNNFYDLGNLSKNSLSLSGIYGNKELQGTDDEKKKYSALMQLKDKIEECMGHLQLEKYYSSLRGIEFVIKNDGTMFDEDVDVDLIFPIEMILLHDELNVPSEPICTNGEWSLEDIFGIPGRYNCKNYELSEKKMVYHNSETPVDLFYSIDYEQSYRDTLDEIFDYEVFEDDKKVTIRLHLDYIKQHDCIAFPTWIFLKDMDEYAPIEFRISSKNQAEVVEGRIEVSDKIEG
jgi:hypothetical protein